MMGTRTCSRRHGEGICTDMCVLTIGEEKEGKDGCELHFGLFVVFWLVSTVVKNLG